MQPQRPAAGAWAASWERVGKAVSLDVDTHALRHFYAVSITVRVGGARRATGVRSVVVDGVFEIT
jgi:hypothetical protein